ncbi:hypothetical protein EDB81DRAFT_323141 [Dactylonectria macrodidyma]|uniref:Uncharacterized protein n=1 Tax=Dactylonectria macrodidyma TaxID=307937 RepID=A0A9P9FFF6_9HYPO|nr:hypothetical protein EDB81DRAFT_323141 [Dactylonectria macrodidyma]
MTRSRSTGSTDPVAPPCLSVVFVLVPFSPLQVLSPSSSSESSPVSLGLTSSAKSNPQQPRLFARLLCTENHTQRLARPRLSLLAPRRTGQVSDLSGLSPPLASLPRSTVRDPIAAPCPSSRRRACNQSKSPASPCPPSPLPRRVQCLSHPAGTGAASEPRKAETKPQACARANEPRGGMPAR